MYKIKQCIVIVTTERTRPFLNDLLSDIGDYDKYPIIIHENGADNNEFEMGGIKRALFHQFDEFFLLHDTCRVKDTALFDTAFTKYRGKSVSISPNFLSYLGKYRRSVLEKMQLPSIATKKEAVDAETAFLSEYVKLEKGNYEVLYPDFDKDYSFVMLHGRKNMTLESDTLIKYKGTWDPKMIKESEGSDGRSD